MIKAFAAVALLDVIARCGGQEPMEMLDIGRVAEPDFRICAAKLNNSNGHPLSPARHKPKKRKKK